MMSDSEYSSTDSEATLDDLPPIVIDANLEEEENRVVVSPMWNPQGSHMLFNNQPLDVMPLNAIPFGQKVSLGKEKEEVPVPQWMKELDLYKDGDWKVFLQIRDDGHKDWSYNHREYQAVFRSRAEVKLFMDTTLINGTNIFKGRKLQKKRALDSNGEGSGGSTSTRAKKITATKKSEKTSSTGNYPVVPKPGPTLPPGFV
uniref:Uncharacterized protein n=2 Tax=Oryza brachyantha TaxID=4533 RepID=J3LZD7_ORYBR